jgi:hypothetical protein
MKVSEIVMVEAARLVNNREILKAAIDPWTFGSSPKVWRLTTQKMLSRTKPSDVTDGKATADVA